MADDDTNLQLLGGALIVLSLALLYCWWNKNKREGLAKPDWSMSPVYGHFRQMDGLAPKWLAKEGMGGMNPDLSTLGDLGRSTEGMLSIAGVGTFSTAGQVMTRTPKLAESMHDMYNPIQNRHKGRQAHEEHNDAMQVRWQADAGIGHDDVDPGSTGYGHYSQSGTRAHHRASQLVGADVLTPMKPVTVKGCNSHSYDQLLNTDYQPQWGINHMHPMVTI